MLNWLNSWGQSVTYKPDKGPVLWTKLYLNRKCSSDPASVNLTTALSWPTMVAINSVSRPRFVSVWPIADMDKSAVGALSRAAHFTIAEQNVIINKYEEFNLSLRTFSGFSVIPCSIGLSSEGDAFSLENWLVTGWRFNSRRSQPKT